MRKINKIILISILCALSVVLTACQNHESNEEFVDPELICGMTATYAKKALALKQDDFPRWLFHMVTNLAYYSKGGDSPVLHSKMKQAIDYAYAQKIPVDEEQKQKFIEAFSERAQENCMNNF